MTEKIDVNNLNGFSEREILIQLVTGFNGQVDATRALDGKLDTFVKILDNKVTREEYALHLQESNREKDTYVLERKEVIRRLGLLEGLVQDGGVVKKTIWNLNKYFWIGFFSLLQIISFITIAFQTGQAEK